MANMAGWLRVRVPLDVRVAVDRTAEGEGLTTSSWVRRLILSALPQNGSVAEVRRVIPASPEAAEVLRDADVMPTVQSLPINEPGRARAGAEAAERAHWEKVARMQKIKGN